MASSSPRAWMVGFTCWKNCLCLWLDSKFLCLVSITQSQSCVLYAVVLLLIDDFSITRFERNSNIATFLVFYFFFFGKVSKFIYIYIYIYTYIHIWVQIIHSVTLQKLHHFYIINLLEI